MIININRSWNHKKHKRKKSKNKSKLGKYAHQQFRSFNYCEMKVYYLIKAFFDYHIVRQFIIDNRYIVDMYIPEFKLIIEVDGNYHNTEEQKQKDVIRENRLISLGFRIIRFSDDEVQHGLLNILDKLENEFNLLNTDISNL